MLKRGRIRIYILDKDTGNPRSNIPVKIVAQYSKKGNRPITHLVSNEKNGRFIQDIGVFQSDQYGYISIESEFYPEHLEKVNLTLLGNEEISSEIKQIDFYNEGKINIVKIPDSILSIKPETFPSYYPDPDIIDRIWSASLKGTKPELRIGELGCEIFYKNALPERKFIFGEILLKNKSHGNINAELVEYESKWFPLGHALGEIVYSTSLAPCESVNIAVIDWSRSDTGERIEETTVEEELYHTLKRDRTIEEVIAGTIKEWQRGGSFTGGLSLAGTIKEITGAIGLGGGYFTSSGSRSVNAESVQRLADSITQAASSVRALRSSVVTQIFQREKDKVVTRTITNHNHCHSITVLYYEILRQYRVETSIKDIKQVLFLKINEISEAFGNNDDLLFKWILSNWGLLRNYLLDPDLGKCFDVLTGESSDNEKLTNIYVTLKTADIKNAGTDADVYLILQKDSGEIKEYSLDTEGANDRERNSLDSYVIDTTQDNIYPEEIKSIGLKFERKGEKPGWKPEYIKITFSSTGKEFFSYRKDFGEDEWFISNGTYWFHSFKNPLKENIQDKKECKKRLLEHFRENKYYYAKVVYMSKDPGYYFDKFPNLLGKINYFPVAMLSDYVGFVETDKKGKKPDFKEERYIALPVRGVFGETRLAHCNSCEEKDITRFWDWKESPCPEKAPEITGIKLGSRAKGLDLSNSEFPKSILNIVNPPQAPEPTGIAEALKILSKSDIFRDMSGKKEVSEIVNNLINTAKEIAKSKKADSTNKEEKKDKDKNDDKTDSDKKDDEGEVETILVSNRCTDISVEERDALTPEEIHKEVNLIMSEFRKGKINREEAVKKLSALKNTPLGKRKIDVLIDENIEDISGIAED